MRHPYKHLETHPLWRVVCDALGCLVENQDLTLTTADQNVIGFIVSKAAGENPILIDWLNICSKDEFYNLVLPQCEAPSWHGRNLDALNDSWVAGDINGVKLPYSFWFINGLQINSQLLDFRAAVEEIAVNSIEENGGQIHRVEEEANISDLNFSRKC